MLYIRTANQNCFIICRRQEDTDSQILVQLDVFDEQKTNDEDQLPGVKGVDLNSPLDVFHAIFKQVNVINKYVNWKMTCFSLCHLIGN